MKNATLLVLTGAVLGVALFFGSADAQRVHARRPYITDLGRLAPDRQAHVYKVTDFNTHCYIVGTAISCVRL
jgi:hypothetical protein